MEARAINRYVGSSPRKMRLVIDLIRGKSVDEALHILHFSPKHASEVAETGASFGCVQSPEQGPGRSARRFPHGREGSLCRRFGDDEADAPRPHGAGISASGSVRIM